MGITVTYGNTVVSWSIDKAIVVALIIQLSV